MSQTILVTGGGGWLGSAIVEKLLAQGKKVIALDLRIPPSLVNRAAGDSHLVTVEGDLAEWSQVVDLFHKYTPDAVIHVAAIVGVVLAADIPIKALNVNTAASVNLLEAIRLHGTKRIVYISTEETYGDFNAPVIREDHPQRPTSVYGLTKLATEHYGRIYAARYRFEFISIRTCWVYGPNLPRARVPKIFIDAALDGTSCHLPAGGDLAVDQVYIDDVVTGVLLALEKPVHRFDAYHIATGEAPTISDVVRYVRELVPGADVSAAPGPYLHGGQFPCARKGALDIARAATELNYRPKFDLRMGIAATFAAEREQRLRTKG